MAHNLSFVKVLVVGKERTEGHKSCTWGSIELGERKMRKVLVNCQDKTQMNVQNVRLSF